MQEEEGRRAEGCGVAPEGVGGHRPVLGDGERMMGGLEVSGRAAGECGGSAPGFGETEPLWGSSRLYPPWGMLLQGENKGDQIRAHPHLWLHHESQPNHPVGHSRGQPLDPQWPTVRRSSHS